MKNISKLLEKEKWEIRSLGDIATEIFAGSGVTEEQLGTGNFPAVKNKDIGKLPHHFCECRSFINPELIKNKRYFEYGDLLISNMGGKRDVGKGCTYLGKEKCIAGNHVIVVKHKENPKFLSYMFSSEACRKQISQYARGATVNDLRLSAIKTIKIPLPPRHIQDLIADYLDHWTKLEQELEKELADRKKQYQHYKELVLTSEKDKWETRYISEIARDIYIGSEVKKDQLGTGDYPAIKCGDVNSGLPLHFTECISFVNPDLIPRKRYFEYGDVLIGKIGNVDTSGRAVVYLGKEKCLLGDAVYALKHNQNPKFMGYILSTQFIRKQIAGFYKPGTVFNFFIREIKQLHIPLPPLEEQEKIVSKLDKFRTIAEDLEEGIPKLLALTRQQYEYYKEEILKLTD